MPRSRVKGRLWLYTDWRSAPLTRWRGDTLEGGSKYSSFALTAIKASVFAAIFLRIYAAGNICLERAANALRGHGHAVDDALLQYLSPLGWEHVNLTGDYLWRSSVKVGAGKFRPLRPMQSA